MKTQHTLGEKRFHILGTTDDVTTCDCCGKTGLKVTVVIEDLQNGQLLYFGTTCASKADKYDTLQALDNAKAEIKKHLASDRVLRKRSYRLALKQLKPEMIERVGTYEFRVKKEFESQHFANIDRIFGELKEKQRGEALAT